MKENETHTQRERERERDDIKKTEIKLSLVSMTFPKLQTQSYKSSTVDSFPYLINSILKLDQRSKTITIESQNPSLFSIFIFFFQYFFLFFFFFSFFFLLFFYFLLNDSITGMLIGLNGQ